MSDTRKKLARPHCHGMNLRLECMQPVLFTLRSSKIVKGTAAIAVRIPTYRRRLVLHSSIRLSKTDGTSFVAPQRLKSQRAQRVAAARHAPFYTSIEE